MHLHKTTFISKGRRRQSPGNNPSLLLVVLLLASLLLLVVEQLPILVVAWQAVPHQRPFKQKQDLAFFQQASPRDGVIHSDSFNHDYSSSAGGGDGLFPRQHRRSWTKLFLSSTSSFDKKNDLTPSKQPEQPLGNRSRHRRRPRRSSSNNYKKKAIQQRKRATAANNRPIHEREQELGYQTWRVFGLAVHPDSYLSTTTTTTNSSSCSHDDKSSIIQAPRKEAMTEDDQKQAVLQSYLTQPVLQALRKRLGIMNTTSVVPRDVRVVRRSLDARQRRAGQDGPQFMFVVDVDIALDDIINQLDHLQHQPGRLELLSPRPPPSTEKIHHERDITAAAAVAAAAGHETKKKKQVVIVGAGPAGLFCALVLARSGHVQPIVLERGKPVEERGRDIGALMHRQKMHSESNFSFGEGGAGTWSDGKLTTRIGRNSNSVRFVLETFVQYGAPPSILVEGSPHLGTDNLVRLLRNLRQDLQDNLGGKVLFDTKMTSLQLEKEEHEQDAVVKGVHYSCSNSKSCCSSSSSSSSSTTHNPTTGDNDISESSSSTTSTQTHIPADAVVLATGHSARDVYQQLHKDGVFLEAKGFAVGFRIEHPQTVINQIQYGNEWGPSVVTGRRSTDVLNQEFFQQQSMDQGGDETITGTTTTTTSTTAPVVQHGKLPVPSYRLATNTAFDGEKNRGVYSFCMCPGGQIVPSSTQPGELCVNGMSFSRRDSKWANSAMVVTVDPQDEILQPYHHHHHHHHHHNEEDNDDNRNNNVLAGLAFQQDMEERAYKMGGGNYSVPVQRLTDFLDGIPSTSAPSSSYRLGVKPSACHTIYPPPLVNALRDAIVHHFEHQMPGYIHPDALLHAVETRTSSPVRVPRDSVTLEAIRTTGLYPSGEGAGYAGGIVSAAVDGMAVAEAILEKYGFLDDASSSSSSSTAAPDVKATTTSTTSTPQKQSRIKGIGFSY